jgi:hypothetical protein
MGLACAKADDNIENYDESVVIQRRQIGLVSVQSEPLHALTFGGFKSFKQIKSISD